MSEELDAVLGSDPSAAAAVESVKLDIPPETRNRSGGITTKGGLWIAVLNGADWYETMHAALTVSLEAHYRYGFGFCPTHRIIEALGRRVAR